VIHQDQAIFSTHFSPIAARKKRHPTRCQVDMPQDVSHSSWLRCYNYVNRFILPICLLVLPPHLVVFLSSSSMRCIRLFAVSYHCSPFSYLSPVFFTQSSHYKFLKLHSVDSALYTAELLLCSRIPVSPVSVECFIHQLKTSGWLCVTGLTSANLKPSTHSFTH